MLIAIWWNLSHLRSVINRATRLRMWTNHAWFSCNCERKPFFSAWFMSNASGFFAFLFCLLCSTFCCPIFSSPVCKKKNKEIKRTPFSCHDFCVQVTTMSVGGCLFHTPFIVIKKYMIPLSMPSRDGKQWLWWQWSDVPLGGQGWPVNFPDELPCFWGCRRALDWQSLTS